MNKNEVESFIYSLARATDLPMLVTSADADCPVILYVNRAFVAATGFGSEVYGHTPRLFQTDDTSCIVRNRIKIAISQKKSVTAELVNQDSAGGIHKILMLIFPVLWAGESVVFASVQRSEDDAELRGTLVRAIETQSVRFTTEKLHWFKGAAHRLIGFADDHQQLKYHTCIADLSLQAIVYGLSHEGRWIIPVGWQFFSDTENPGGLLKLKKIVEAGGADPKKYILLISLDRNLDRRLKETVRVLKHMGFSICIAGVGGPSASIYEVATLEPDAIMLDGLVIEEIETASDERRLRLFCSMAEMYGLRLIVSGVTDDQTLTRLNTMNVWAAQGPAIEQEPMAPILSPNASLFRLASEP
mgnify:FL=1